MIAQRGAPPDAMARRVGVGVCMPYNGNRGLIQPPCAGVLPRCPCVSGLCSASRQASSSATCFATNARKRRQSAFLLSCASASRRSSSCAIATRYETFISSPPLPLSPWAGFGFVTDLPACLVRQPRTQGIYNNDKLSVRVKPRCGGSRRPSMWVIARLNRPAVGRQVGTASTQTRGCRAR